MAEYIVRLGEKELGLFNENGLIMRSKEGTPIRGDETKMRELYPDVPPGRFQPQGTTVIVVPSGAGVLPMSRLIAPGEAGEKREAEEEKKKDSIDVQIISTPVLSGTVEVRNPKP